MKYCIYNFSIIFNYLYTKANGLLYLQAGLESCPECTILEPVIAWPNLTEAQVGKSGPCGWNARSSIDYNEPATDWGNTPVTTYAPGDIVEVQWCIDHNSDHGGMFSWRICQNQTLVDKFLTPGYLPTDEENQAAEDCFQEGLLKCTDVSGQTCGYSADCTEGEPCWRNDWFTCNGFYAATDPGCIGVDEASLNSCYTSIAGGYTVTKKVKIPDYISDHTLISLRWNSFQTEQVYLTCADIAISNNGSSTAPVGSATSSIGSSTTISTGTSTAGGTTRSSTTSSGVSTTSSACTAASSVAVTFNEVVTTEVGQTIKVSGSIPELGNWDTSSAPALSASQYTTSNNIWSYTATLGAGESFQYKFISVGSSGTIDWESDPNRSFTVPESCETAVTINNTWQQAL